MAMWKYFKYFDEKIFENICYKILSLPYFRKFSHSKISTYTVAQYAASQQRRCIFKGNLVIVLEAALFTLLMPIIWKILRH